MATAMPTNRSKSLVFKGPASAPNVGSSDVKKLKERLGRRATLDLFSEHDERVPAIGGCIEIQAGHSPHLLPLEVILFEPSLNEIWAGGVVNQPGKLPGTRLIFLNSKLEPCEVDSLEHLHQLLRSSRQSGDFPRFIHLHALRLLQYRHFNVPETVKLLCTHLEERVKRLPISESQVLEDLKSGFMYWHGRDKFCRPCLVIRIERLRDLASSKERTVRLLLYVIEYGIRYALVPGRVENLVVLLDLQNASSVINIWQIASLAATGKAIGVTLEQVYCGRMVWLKLLNMPSFLASVVSGLIPAEKKKKVQVVKDASTEVAPLFMPNQLEKRYGGQAPDLGPADVYPFKFFPNCTGTADTQSSTAPTSYHDLATREYHEGQLWDDSFPEHKDMWAEPSKKMPLTPQSAADLSQFLGEEIRPCQDVETWKKLVTASEHMDNAIEQEEEPQAPEPAPFAAPEGTPAPAAVEVPSVTSSSIKEQEEIRIEGQAEATAEVVATTKSCWCVA